MVWSDERMNMQHELLCDHLVKGDEETSSAGHRDTSCDAAVGRVGMHGFDGVDEMLVALVFQAHGASEERKCYPLSNLHVGWVLLFDVK